jgi:PLAC8 family protein
MHRPWLTYQDTPAPCRLINTHSSLSSLPPLTMSAPQSTVPVQDAVPPPQNSAPPPQTTIAATPPVQPAKPGPIDHRDVEEWTQRFNKALEKPGETLHSTSPAGAEGWKNSFFACFNPISLCAVTCCLPCITFGKTHHRLRRDPNLEGYQPVNTSVRPMPRSFSSFLANPVVSVPPAPCLLLPRPLLCSPGDAARRDSRKVQPRRQLHVRPGSRLLLRLLRPDAAGERGRRADAPRRRSGRQGSLSGSGRHGVPCPWQLRCRVVVISRCCAAAASHILMIPFVQRRDGSNGKRPRRNIPR